MTEMLEGGVVRACRGARSAICGVLKKKKLHGMDLDVASFIVSCLPRLIRVAFVAINEAAHNTQSCRKIRICFSFKGHDRLGKLRFHCCALILLSEINSC